MGCCASTKRSSSASTFQKQDRHFHEGSDSFKPISLTHESRAPPPMMEEEAVKEVLSETPKPKQFPHAPPQQHEQPHQENSNKIVDNIEPAFLDEKMVESRYRYEKGFQEEISEQEVSEVCNSSESVSTTTMTNERRYDDEDNEVKQRVLRSPAAKLSLRNRSFSDDFGPKRGRVVGNSPNRLSEQSPNKRNYAGVAGGGSRRLVQSKQLGSSHAERRGISSDPNIRDPGEASGSRSRSPATGRFAVGCNPSDRRTNRSPGRPRTNPPENGSNRLMADGIGNHNNYDGIPNETLDNPFVSLECFIFL